MALDINVFARPIAQVDVTIGTVYLYQANENVRKLFRSLIHDTSEQRGKKILAQITSLEKRTKLKEDIILIPEEIFLLLTEDDVAMISEQFRQLIDRNCVLPEKPFPSIESQLSGEPAFTFFERVLGTNIANEDAAYKEKMKDLMRSFDPTSKLLEQLNLSSDRLSGTLREFDNIKS